VIYPWQEVVWQRLELAARAQRLPHALLISGPVGSGKSEFAQAFANAMLCAERAGDTGFACGNCRACRLLRAQTHPDLAIVRPEKEGAAIKVDQIRALNDAIGLHSHLGGYKIFVLDPADAMNRNSANSLLKSLEEPPSNTVFVLVASQISVLPATIRSRCQHFAFNPQRDPVAIDWLRSEIPADRDAEVLLALADGGPLRARELVATKRDRIREELLDSLVTLSAGGAPLAVAEQWNSHGAVEVFGWLAKLVADLSVLGASGDSHLVVNRDLLERLQVLIKELNLRNLFTLYQKLLEFRQYLTNASGLRELELLEEIAIQWVQHVSQPEALSHERTGS
jgi:DNA polymerase-3 subunit delta'